MQRNRRKEKGAVIAESAISILLMLTLLIASVEFGRAYNIFQTITNAAREGARFSVAPQSGTADLPTPEEVQARVEQFMASTNIKNATVNVNQTLIGPEVSGAQTVYTEVNVQAPYNFLFFPFGSVPLNTQARMRNETN
jgi:Flp pilus assembly protein TadG